MEIRKNNIYLADLNPRYGTEPGKIRPVVAIQTNMLNDFHPSTIVCPITSKLSGSAEFLRVSLYKEETGLDVDSEIIVDQIRSIDNKRFLKRIGEISDTNIIKLYRNLNIIILD